MYVAYMIIRDERHVTEAVLAETGRADDPRLAEIVRALVRHLHDFAREVRLTEAEFDASLGLVARLGQLTTPSHNEVRLMAGTLGLSTLVCLMNNGTEEEPTSANLLGPFWRQGSPVMSNGDSIVRSPTDGPPLFFTGTVVDTAGRPVAGAEIDVWHASPVGLYENQDPDQAEWNLRGKFFTDQRGVFAFRSVRPSGYPIPTTGPVGDLLAALKRHPFRPAHVHAMVYKPGYKTIASQIYSHDDPMLETDAQFGVTGPLIATYQRHEAEPAPDPDVTEPWYSLDYTFVVEPGEAWLPTPPVSAKAGTKDQAGPKADAGADAAINESRLSHTRYFRSVPPVGQQPLPQRPPAGRAEGGPRRRRHWRRRRGRHRCPGRPDHGDRLAARIAAPVEQGGLARAAAADDRHQFPGADRQRHLLQGDRSGFRSLTRLAYLDRRLHADYSAGPGQPG